jgi:hypothetical protein
VGRFDLLQYLEHKQYAPSVCRDCFAQFLKVSSNQMLTPTHCHLKHNLHRRRLWPMCTERK